LYIITDDSNEAKNGAEGRPKAEAGEESAQTNEDVQLVVIFAVGIEK
jgi:hypothetical protein